VVKMYIVNPPGILSLMWKVAKCIMDQKSQSRIEFLFKPEDLLLHLDAHAVPAAFGGTWTDTSGWAEEPEYCCNSAKTIVSIDYPKPHQVWFDNGFKCAPPMIHGTIKSKQTFVVSRTVTKPGTRLVWEFDVNGDVDFDITRTECAGSAQQGKEEPVWPRLTLNCLKMNEQGHLVCKEPGEYRLRFTNSNSTWFVVKLEYAVGLID
uniref:CRAL-TRIO domain-containing protein n=1 Tax=Plectus sambesii TaxID=2011161 RepID=A0A914VPI8_9BILA